MLGSLELVLVGFGLRKGSGAAEWIQLGRERWRNRCLLVPVLLQRDQALVALKALVQVLGAEVGSQVMELVEGLLHQKPASPVPATATHAEMVARLHELYASEKRLTKKLEEAKGRLEKAGAKVLEEGGKDG